jgi:anti-anti-sigma factor
LAWSFYDHDISRAAHCQPLLQEIGRMSSLSHEVRLTTRTVGDVTIVTFNERKILDELSVANMGEKLLGLVEAGTRKMVLNFENVGALSSAALGKYFHLHRELVEERHGQMVLCCIVDHLLEVMRIMCMDRKFTIVKNEQEALERF